MSETGENDGRLGPLLRNLFRYLLSKSFVLLR
jgi:hypothetical protein